MCSNSSPVRMFSGFRSWRQSFVKIWWKKWRTSVNGLVAKMRFANWGIFLILWILFKSLCFILEIENVVRVSKPRGNMNNCILMPWGRYACITTFAISRWMQINANDQFCNKKNSLLIFYIKQLLMLLIFEKQLCIVFNPTASTFSVVGFNNNNILFIMCYSFAFVKWLLKNLFTSKQVNMFDCSSLQIG